MPKGPNKSYLYVERIRERLPRVLQELREAVPITKYGLEQKCGITREMIGRVEAGGVKKPGLWVIAQIAHGLGLTMTELLRRVEDDAAAGSRRRQR